MILAFHDEDMLQQGSFLSIPLENFRAIEANSDTGSCYNVQQG